MRDRMSHLQDVSEGQGGASVEKEVPGPNGTSDGPGASNGVAKPATTPDPYTNVDLGDVPIQQQAVVFDNDGTMDKIFDEAQTVRQEVQLIRLDVEKLKGHNARSLNELSDKSADLRKDSNAVAGQIKSRAEAVLTRLQKMDARTKELEAKLGGNVAAVRVARTQYMSLSNNFRDVMFDYNEAEMSFRESCKARLQRQLEIVGREVTGEEIDQMIERGEFNVFTDDILTEGKTSKSALDQIETRHQELLDLESRLQGIHEIFLDVAMLVEEQGPMMNNIEANIQNTDAALQECIVKLERAKRYDKSNPCKKMFCGCFPCYND
ncbi:syntaxin-11b.1 [Conger conger]|uniref:syntaxin-11b.1 n=1 Tax=Conger conger TaxID=82655 RepID=UPI002A5AC6D3|nr:syntaxin-11b.1 [Conger conger]XP_061097798.1 syntaxin-11b.1 [Conger conger]